MTANPYLLELVLRSSALLVLLWLAAIAVRTIGGSAAMRHSVWLFGIAALLVLPLVSVLAPPLPVSALPDIFGSRHLGSVAGSPMLATAARSAPDTAASFDWVGAAQMTYAAIAIALLVRLAGGWCLLARLWRDARPADDDGKWSRMIGELTASLGLRRPVELRIADQAIMPMTWGFFTPRILLPAHARSWTEERCRLVLMHELAHVARADSASRIAASVACALYWFHPMIWHSAKAMRLEQEHACDDLVLSQGARASDYAQDLLDAARGFRAPMLGVPCVAMVRTSELERRLLAIVGRRARNRSPGMFLAGSAATVVVATLVIATAVPDYVRVAPPAVALQVPATVGPDVAPGADGPGPKIGTQPAAIRPRARNTERLTGASGGRAVQAGSATSVSMPLPAVPDIAPLPAQPPIPVVPAVPPAPAVPPVPAAGTVSAVHPAAG